MLVRFPLNQLLAYTTSSGNLTKQNCFVFLEARGFENFAAALQKFADSEEIVNQILKIISVTLKYLYEDSVFLRCAETDIPKNCIAILVDEKRPDSSKLLALEILDKLADVRLTHEILISHGIFDFLLRSFQEIMKTGANLKHDNLKKLARLFDIINNMGENPKTADRLISSGCIGQMVTIYTQYREVNFLRDLFVNSLFQITKTKEGQAIIKDAKINIEELINHAVDNQNHAHLKSIESIISRVSQRQEVDARIAEVLAGANVESNILFLGFVVPNQNFSGLLERPELFRAAVSILRNDKVIVNKYGAALFIGGLILNNPKFISDFVSENGLKILTELLGKHDSHILTIGVLDLLRVCIEVGDAAFCQQLVSENVIETLFGNYNQMGTLFEEFFSQALTTEKALDSIEYYKSDVTRSILESMKEVKPDELVPMKKAIEYIFGEKLSVAILRNIDLFYQKNKTLSHSADVKFVNTCHAQMRVFKNSRVVYTSIFAVLCRLRFSKELVDHTFITLNWPFILTDVVWKKTTWNRFALHVVRWIEQLTAVKDNYKALTNSINTVKLVASIKHFINEEDYKEFEGDEEVAAEDSDSIDFTEEREIQAKGGKILEALMEPQSAANFKVAIEKSISNFKPIPEAIQILRAEYAVMASINALNVYGTEGLLQRNHLSFRQNIDELERAVGRKDFPDKEKLIGDCIRCLSNYVCITWNENGKNLYEKSDISSIVFELFDKYLRNSKTPLTSYVLLKAYKEWLSNRIDIIEAASNSEREKIYDPESFMMVPAAKREQAITNAMDTLYTTVSTFESNGKVVSTSFEVIILLGYMYPKWRQKVGKNFIPIALNALCNVELPKGTDSHAIDLLKHIVGLDESSDKPSIELAKYAAECNGLEKICKSIADNNFDEKYVQKCKPLIDLIAAHSSVKDSEDLIAKLVAKIRAYNEQTPEHKLDKKNLLEIIQTSGQLNSLLVSPMLRDYAFQIGHAAVLHNFLDFLNQADVKGPAIDSLV